MMLVDSSAWIEFYREKGRADYKTAVVRNLQDNSVATCGIVKTELQAHARTIKEYHLLESDFDGMVWIETDFPVYRKAAEMGFRLRQKGMTIPATDLIIASCALINGLEILHLDKHFDLIKTVYPLKTISFKE
jgi:predicted nucleic acid-binding protein